MSSSETPCLRRNGLFFPLLCSGPHNISLLAVRRSELQCYIWNIIPSGALFLSGMINFQDNPQKKFPRSLFARRTTVEKVFGFPFFRRAEKTLLRNPTAADTAQNQADSEKNECGIKGRNQGPESEADIRDGIIRWRERRRAGRRERGKREVPPLRERAPEKKFLSPVSLFPAQDVPFPFCAGISF